MQKFGFVIFVLMIFIDITFAQTGINSSDLEVITPDNYQRLEQIATLGTTWRSESGLAPV